MELASEVFALGLLQLDQPARERLELGDVGTRSDSCSSTSRRASAWSSVMSVLVPYHLTIFPCSLRSGTVRTRNQRYSPSARRKRISSSHGFPTDMSVRHFSMTLGRTSG